MRRIIALILMTMVMATASATQAPLHLLPRHADKAVLEEARAILKQMAAANPQLAHALSLDEQQKLLITTLLIAGIGFGAILYLLYVVYDLQETVESLTQRISSLESLPQSLAIQVPPPGGYAFCPSYALQPTAPPGYPDYL